MRPVPSTMRAAVLKGSRTIEVAELDVPKPAQDSLLLKVERVGIGGADRLAWDVGSGRPDGVILGREVAGEVVHDAAGEWSVGTQVTVFPVWGCGDCAWCETGEPRFCLNPPGDRLEGFAEYMVAPRRNVFQAPAGLSPELTALADPLGLASRAVAYADPESGDIAYVGGLGPVGLFVVSVLVSRGCIVIGADPRDDRRKLGSWLGCADVIDPTWDDPFEATTAFTPFGPRFAFECSGDPDGLRQVFHACGPSGMVAILGAQVDTTSLAEMARREQWVFAVAGSTRPSMQAALRHAVDHPELGDVISHVISLNEVGVSIEELSKGRGGLKVVVDPSA